MLPTGWHGVKNTITFEKEEVASIYNIFYPANVFRKRNTGGWAQIDEIMGDTPFSSFDLVQCLWNESTTDKILSYKQGKYLFK